MTAAVCNAVSPRISQQLICAMGKDKLDRLTACQGRTCSLPALHIIPPHVAHHERVEALAKAMAAALLFNGVSAPSPRSSGLIESSASKRQSCAFADVPAFERRTGGRMVHARYH